MNNMARPSPVLAFCQPLPQVTYPSHIVGGSSQGKNRIKHINHSTTKGHSATRHSCSGEAPRDARSPRSALSESRIGREQLAEVRLAAILATGSILSVTNLVRYGRSTLQHSGLLASLPENWGPELH